MSGDESGNVVPLHRHEDIQELLPWFVTGRLDAADRSRVEMHLANCAECQADVRFQRQLNAEIAALPLDVEHSWQTMRGRVTADARTRAGRPQWRTWIGWAAAAGVAVALGGAGATLLPGLGRKAEYRALGAAPTVATGNLVVIFRPEATEQELRDSLRAAGARLVDGPTATDGYVLFVPAANRAAALARLQARPSVVLAQPIGAAP